MKKSILLIEDEPKVEARIKEILDGYQVEAVSKVEAAADFLGKKKVALIILDFDLKAIDGLQALRRIRALAPQTNCLTLSASNQIPLAVSATKLGAADFLKKPVAAESLRLSVEKNISAGE